jgi:hypothetical protein
MAARECLPQPLHALMRGRCRIALEALLERRNLERTASTACTAPPSCVGILTGLVKIGARRSAESTLPSQCNATPHTDESDILGMCVLVSTTL